MAVLPLASHADEGKMIRQGDILLGNVEATIAYGWGIPLVILNYYGERVDVFIETKDGKEYVCEICNPIESNRKYFAWVIVPVSMDQVESFNVNGEMFIYKKGG